MDIPTISISALREMSAARLQKEGKSYELTSDGKFLGFLIIPQNNSVADVCRFQAQMSNITAGVE
ncbi:MAG: hypothetical protein JRE40_00890 [Deltaproteobacteria bacterium]|nr:hypothetical protein [Deltaproteobacteria bacterium]